MITPSFSPTATERVLPKLALDFTTAVLDPRVTVTRALNTATRVNSSGYIETVNADLPRFDYSPTSVGTCKGLLIEESRINLFSYTQAFNSWSKTDSNISTDATTSPNGTVDAEKVTPTTTTSYHGVRTNITLTNATSYIISIYAKKAELDLLCISNTANATYCASFDLTNVTATAFYNCTPSIENAGNGWYRCSVKVTGNGATNTIIFTGYPAGTTLTNYGASFAGDNTSGLYLWGAQLEAGAFVTSYIPVVAAGPITRNADVATMTGTNFSSWYNASEGTFTTTFTTMSATLNHVLYVSDGTSNNNIRFTGLNQFVVTSGGSTQSNLSSGSPVANTLTKYCGAYKASNFGFSANAGATQTTLSGTVPTVSQMNIGSRVFNDYYLNGTIAKLAYYPQRLTNAEVQAFSK